MILVAPVIAQEPFQLSHTVTAMEQSGTGTLVNYRLMLSGSSAENYHNVHLSLHDVSLSVTDLTGSLNFHTVSSGQKKHRFLSLHSALSGSQLDTSNDLLFHLQATDAQGQVYSILLRSSKVQK